MNPEPHLQFNPEAPTQVHATPHLATDRDGEPPAAGCSVCPAVSYETQFHSGRQERSTTPTIPTTRITTVSNIDAAGPGESGPCGLLPADTVPTADGGLGPRETTFTGMVPTSDYSLGPCGKPLADTDLDAVEWMGPHETTFTEAAPSSNTNTTKDPYGETSPFDETQKGGHHSYSLVASGGLEQATSASHFDGGDRSNARKIWNLQR
jgi:hypothetical protein